MSLVREMSRAAVGGYLKVVRLPADAAVRLRNRNGGPEGSRAEIALDRVEARARDFAGRALRDESLREDAERRRIAADERARALRLHNEAEVREEGAKERYAEHIEEVDQKREGATRRAQQERQQAARRRRQATEQAERVEQQRKEAVETTAQQVDEAVEGHAKRARLATLDEEAAALAKREEALAAQDEAQRLQKAAGRAKAARKSST